MSTGDEQPDRRSEAAEPEQPDTKGDTKGDVLGNSSARRPGARRALLVAVAVVSAGLLTVGGIGAYNLSSAVFGGPSGHPHATSAVPAAPAAPPGADQAAATAKAFLAAWTSGDLDAASQLTDRPKAAAAQLFDFQQKLGYTSLTSAVGGQDAGSPPTTADIGVGFKVTVSIGAAGSNPWTYQGGLNVRQSDGRPVVHWDPSVINPLLTGSNSIALRAIAASAATPMDRNGRSLDGFPSLGPLLAPLRPPATAQPADPTSGNGQAVVLIDAGGGNAQQLFVVSRPQAATQVKLTIDADVQKAAEAAVAAQSTSGNPVGLVAIEPSTGNILAVANAPAKGFNQAFLAQVAPGSTMKVITAAALLEAGDTPDTPVPCPPTANSPRLWPNDEPGNFSGYTLSDDFAHSCNTAFIQETQHKGVSHLLPEVARQFGLGQAWSTAPGVSSFDAVVPVPVTSDDAAAEAIGQYNIQANPLAMASLAATVQNGTFHQPILLPGQPQVTAAQPLSSRVAGQLRSMMAQTAASGTARQAMAGLSGQVGAKTGTAEVNGAPAPNSWFIGYRGNLAVAVEVESGGHGAGAAGQAAAQVLAVGNG